MEFANDRNAKVIAITDSVHSPMNLYSSCNLLARSDMVSVVDSLVAPLSVINALVVALCLKCPEQVRKNLEQIEQQKIERKEKTENELLVRGSSRAGREDDAQRR